VPPRLILNLGGIDRCNEMGERMLYNYIQNTHSILYLFMTYYYNTNISIL
jgi:ribosomal protein S6